MEKKISLIGAGTGTFSVNLIKDLCLSKSLDGSTISLMDINEKRLDAVHRFCVRYAAEQGRQFTIEKTTDRLECLKNADFVINSALVGGYDRVRAGWKIAKELGYHFGASFHVLHDEAFWINFGQLRLMEDIYLDMQKVCPDAWYIMVANPVMASVTYFHRKYPGIKMVGMCHGYNGVYRLCETMGLDRSKISFQCPGINHFVWLNHFTYEGRDALPLVKKWMDEKADEFGRSVGFCNDYGPKTTDIYRRYGLVPIGDTCTPGGGAWGWEYHTSREVEQQFNENPEGWYDVVFQMNNERIRSIIDDAWDDSVNLSEKYSTVYSDEPMIPLVEALACDEGRVVIVNTVNDKEYVQGVPRDFEVEIPAWVSSEGIQGIQTKPLPKPLQAYMLRERIATVELELEAYRTHSKELLIDLVMTDPNTRSRKQAQELVERILDMPGLEEMKQYYK